MSAFSELSSFDIGHLLYGMASSIARSQIELDRASIEVAEMMGGLKTVYDDDHHVTFEDSRVFFGHEYMTLAQAMVTQSEGNPAVKALMSGATITYKDYTLPSDATVADPSLAIGAQATVALTETSLATYQEVAQRIRTRIGFHENLREAELGKPAPSKGVVKHLNDMISGLKNLEAENKANVAGVFERQVRVPTRLSLLELGFAPVFYAFVDTILEVKLSVATKYESTSTVGTQETTNATSASVGFKFTPFGKGKASASKSTTVRTVDAEFQNKYTYSAEGSSLMRTKLTPLPPPPVLEERVRAMLAAEQARKAAELGLLTQAAGTA